MAPRELFRLIRVNVFSIDYVIKVPMDNSTDAFCNVFPSCLYFEGSSLGVRKTWLKDIPGYVERADANWNEKVSTGSFE